LGHDLDPEAARPFVEVSGRKGLGVKADDLLDRLTEAARGEVIARHADLSADDPEASSIATVIATAAIRYFMIKYSRGKLIAFDIDEALSFEGESGPYVQYAAVRAANILRKLYERDGLDDETLVAALAALPAEPLADPGDGTAAWALLLEAARLDEVADQSIRALELSVLAKYAFGLAQMFNTFYHRCPVVAEEDEPTRLWRAAAVLYCRRQLTRSLALMGCEVPPRM
ncbi:MAG: DALR anticodon-binding domain-containing protein, partial [Acidobacteria bacterium]|nr:DALR anticodon-binding domain-containing protein [Acidobacteriota bacterium]